MKNTVLVCAAVLTLAACDNSTTTAANNEKADAPRIASSYLPVAASTPAAASINTEAVLRPAAEPANAREWADLQNAASALWSVGEREGAAHDRLMRALRRSAENLDAAEMAKALLRYQFALRDLQKQLGAITLPEISNEEAAGYLVTAQVALDKGLELEMRKNEALIHSMGSGESPSDDELQAQNAAVNEQTGRAVMAISRTYWTYGYQSTDIDDKTFRIKKGVKPQAMVDFNRG
ncbi:hypothetical protein [Paraburkholderia hospita]|uniref:hypothetical protein n=1 Tax=Paraburkholderia hospita TaxID=169430 RepID=UPI003ECFB8E2